MVDVISTPYIVIISLPLPLIEMGIELFWNEGLTSGACGDDGQIGDLKRRVELTVDDVT